MDKVRYWEGLLERALKISKRIQKDPDACSLRAYNLIHEIASMVSNEKEV